MPTEHSRLLLFIHLTHAGPRSRPEVTAEAVVSGIIEDILDSICPAERAVSEVISYILDQVDKTVRPRGMFTKALSLLRLMVDSLIVDWYKSLGLEW